MIRTFNETDNNISLIYDDCTIDYSIVQSVILEFTKKSKFILDDNSSVKPAFFLNCDEKVYWTIEKTEEIKKSNVYDVEIQIVNNPTKVITQIAEKNLVHGTNILFDFHNTDFIKIGTEIYEINKLKSKDDILFLKKPIKEELNDLKYNPVLIKHQCIFLGKELIKKINKIIVFIIDWNKKGCKRILVKITKNSELYF